MAKVENDLLGGTIGNISAGSWKGINYFRSKPNRVDFDNCSSRELGNRKSFRAVNELAKVVKGILIKPIWDKEVKEAMSGYNWFIKQNKRAYNSEGKLIDPRMLKLIVGNLPLPFNITMNCKKEDELIAEINWENPPLLDSWFDKDVLECIFFVDEKPKLLLETEFKREDKKAILELPRVEGEQCSVFVYFKSADGDKYSDSFCLLV